MRLKDNTNLFIHVNPPYQLMVIHSSKLVYPRELYQRGVERKRVELIAAHFNEYVANEPKVSFRNGQFIVTDGQHTIEGRILRNGGKDLPILCKVYTGMTVEQEALLFAEQNGFSAPLTAGMLKEGFYHRPLTVIRPIDIENFLKGMRRDGRSDSYISKARGMLYQIFQKAEANDLVRRNPVRLAEKMRASGTAKRKEAFTTEEVAHLMKVLPDDRMGLSIRLLLGTGMRMQELLALEPQFIEEDGSVIHIRQAVKVVKGTVSIGSPKSKDSIRDIPVPLNVRPCAIKLRDTTDQFIWESPKTGLPCNPTHFRDVFRKSLEEAGDVRLLTPHSCRHTYVSQMQALGVDIQTIQSIVGHADTEMTEHYLHVQESIRQSAIQLFSEAFSA